MNIPSKHKVISFLTVVMLMVSFTLSPMTNQAQAAETVNPETFTQEDIPNLDISDKEKGILNGVYYDPQTDELLFDESQGEQYYSFSEDEIAQVESQLKDVPEDNIDQIQSSSNDGGITTQVAPAIIWGGVAVVGIFTGSALIFSSMYFNHQEKQNLINRCYDEGGKPSIDNQDAAGVNGTTDSGAAERSGGYEFECVE